MRTPTPQRCSTPFKYVRENRQAFAMSPNFGMQRTPITLSVFRWHQRGATL
jgi:hypothetical protein